MTTTASAADTLTLPQTCPSGLTEGDITQLLGGNADRFWTWMNGQTMSICDGRRYDHDLREYQATGCADTPHGPVVYRWDFERYIAGHPIID